MGAVRIEKRDDIVAAISYNHASTYREADDALTAYEATLTKLTISYEKILDQAEKCLNQSDQWRANSRVEWLANAHGYAARADALIGLVEVATCGSHGGFYPGQTDAQRSTMRARLEFLRDVIRRECAS